MNHSTKNSIIGLALGDAYGKNTEFVPFEYLRRDNYDPSDPLTTPEGEKEEHLLVTDDTQMSIYVTEALGYITDFHNEEKVAQAFIKSFINWFDDERNTHDRAPGNACMGSISLMKRHLASPFASLAPGAYADDNSMGCGTIMRSGWMGLDTRIPDDAFDKVVSIQSEITHGHPLATGSSVILARLVREVRENGLTPDRYLEYALTLVEQNPQWAELSEYLANVELAVSKMEEGLDHLYAYDPCSDLGGGWIAPETLALAIAIGTAYHSTPGLALQRASLTGGDSDSIGAVTGALIGAGHQDRPVEEWEAQYEKLEPFYKDILDNQVYPYLVQEDAYAESE